MLVVREGGSAQSYRPCGMRALASMMQDFITGTELVEGGANVYTFPNHPNSSKVGNVPHHPEQKATLDPGYKDSEVGSMPELSTGSSTRRLRRDSRSSH